MTDHNENGHHNSDAFYPVDFGFTRVRFNTKILIETKSQ
jgi:hypothetical protein